MMPIFCYGLFLQFCVNTGFIYGCAVCMAGSVLQSYICLCSMYGRVCAAKLYMVVQYVWQVLCCKVIYGCVVCMAGSVLQSSLFISGKFKFSF